MRQQLSRSGVSDAVVDDAVLILSELVSNACRHGRPLGQKQIGDGNIRAEWRVDKAGRLVVEVTDGGGPTRPVPATPSVTARGGRGLNIISALAQEWGVRDNASGEVTVWVIVAAVRRRNDLATRVTGPDTGVHPGRGSGTGPEAKRTGTGAGLHSLDGLGGPDGLDGLTGFDGIDGIDGMDELDGLAGLQDLDGLDGLAFVDPFDDAR